jgi:hypothetical protein
MDDFGSNQPWGSPPIIEKPMAVTVFGVLNIVFGCYFLVRIVHSWYKIMAGDFKNSEEMMWPGIPALLLFVVIVGLVVWLIVLGIGLLKMKRWARRGSVLYGWIQIVLIVITLGGAVVSLVIDWKDAPRIILGSITIDNGLAVIHWIYMVLLLVFMKTAKVKQAFAAIEGKK